ncbi:MAG TPA: GNAT family N-acetyltransferase [Thermoplasmata archaeon]|nr:GNAT family N-acetyltransferase [Thermoplasmata archaeon]
MLGPAGDRDNGGGTREVIVRPGHWSDLEELVTVYNHYVERTPVTFEVSPVRPSGRVSWLREHSSGGRYRLLVATSRSDRLLGWATSSPFRPRAAYDTTVESSVYCRPESVGRGIGSRLYAALFEALREEDIERIVAGVTLPNPASVRLHRRFGFRRVGTFHRVGRKFDRYWDVAWFERPARRSPRAQVPAA